MGNRQSTLPPPRLVTEGNKNKTLEMPAPATGATDEKKDESNAKDAVPLPERKDYNHKWFKIERQEVRDPETGKVTNVLTSVVLKVPNIYSYVSGWGVQCTYEQKSKTKYYYRTNLQSLLMNLETMELNQLSMTPEMRALLTWLQEEYIRFIDRTKTLLDDGKITYDALWYIFKKDSKAFARLIDDQVVGFSITSVAYTAGFMGGFTVSGKTLKSNGLYFFEHAQSFTIPSFDTVEYLDSLRVQPMNGKIEGMLNKRGELFRKVALGHHYMQYGGYLLMNRGWGYNLNKADGRLMVDIATFQRMHPEYTAFKDPNAVNNMSTNVEMSFQLNGETPRMKLLSDEALYMTWPFVAGFSFACKKWGEILVSNLSEIVFDDAAYDKVVMPIDKKLLIRALVDQHQKSNAKKDEKKGFADIITGKGNGRIFLLHGPPGVGKTLTAEAVAEHLHVPMYSVSVGELGTNTKDLETKLQEILEVAGIWNAVILLDEADVFLEQRGASDIVRNAMVGIFLRLLEYHQGVMFLTTNRVQSFDGAFQSRISVALHYETLDEEARHRVWNNFCDFANIKGIDTRKLAAFKLNGRQIRNCIQLAQALTLSEGSKVVTMSHVERTIDVATQFDMSSDSKGPKFVENPVSHFEYSKHL